MPSKYRYIVWIILCILLNSAAYSQKSTTLKTCEQAFSDKNLLLLAEQYNVDISIAKFLQAGIWELPVLSIDANLVNPSETRFLDIGSRGQKGIAVEQLLYLGKKKKHEVAFAKSAVELAELQLEDLLRNLKFELRTSFYTIYFEQQKQASLMFQLKNMDSLTMAYDNQVNKGNIPLRDLVRLRSLQMSLQNELISTNKIILEHQEKMMLLTGFDEDIWPFLADENDAAVYFDTSRYIDLSQDINYYIKNNPEFKTFVKVRESRELMLKWQKSLAIPDLTVGLAYDQRGGAFNNQLNATLSIPLPLWNRNKGNIKAAESDIMQSEALLEYKITEIRNKLEYAVRIWRENLTMYNKNDLRNIESLNTVYDGVLKNFQKSNITLLDFTDFTESYNQSMHQISELKKQIVLSAEYINYITNSKIF